MTFVRRLLILALLLAALPVPARAACDPTPPYAATIRETLRIEMRDGVELSAEVWRPDACASVPVILTLTPYHALYKALNPREIAPSLAVGTQFVRLGYAFVMADVRGTYNSGGCWDYGGLKERQDGYDLVEALARLPWSSGAVAMTGGSYDGTTANAAAVEAPPSLRTIVPISAISRWWGYAYQQGARSTYSGESADSDPPSDTPADFMLAYGLAPPPDPAGLTAGQQTAMRWTLCDRVEQALHGYSTQPDYDEFWDERDYLALAHRVTVPVLLSHGFQDYNVKTWEGTAWFQALRTPKIMVAGQWGHADPSSHYGPWNDLLKRWFARWLYGVPNGVENESPVQVVPAGGGVTKQQTWGEAPVTRLALSGDPVSLFDDGALTESEMLRGLEGARAVRFALPGTGGIRIQGRPVLHLEASSDQPSTHLVAVLATVAPDGTRSVVSRAFLNARYADSLRAGADLVPGQRRGFDLEFIDKDHVVPATHTLEVIVASSSTTWVAPDERRATNAIYPAASWLDLPVRP